MCCDVDDREVIGQQHGRQEQGLHLEQLCVVRGVEPCGPREPPMVVQSLLDASQRLLRLRGRTHSTHVRRHVRIGIRARPTSGVAISLSESG